MIAAIPLLGIHPKDLKSGSQTFICILMFLQVQGSKCGNNKNVHQQ